jgi:hypothetical protein
MRLSRIATAMLFAVATLGLSASLVLADDPGNTVPTGATTGAATVQNAASYMFENDAAGLTCMGYHNPVVLASCDAADAAVVRVVSSVEVGGERYEQYKDGSNECLGVQGTSSAGGANLAFGPCSSSIDHSQFWRKINPSSGHWMLKNGHSGKCAGLLRSQAFIGNIVIQGDCNTGSVTQHWHDVT